MHPSHQSNRSSSLPGDARSHFAQWRSSPDPPAAPLTPTPSPNPPTTASANASVPSVPPMSTVRATPSPITRRTESRILAATPSCPT